MCWDDIGERKLLGPELITQTVDKVAQIRKHLKAEQERQQNWADSRRPLEFMIGDYVFLKISLNPMCYPIWRQRKVESKVH